MGFLTGRPRKAQTARRKRRDFEAAQMSRLVSGWTFGATTSDSEIQRNLPALVARSRDLSSNNDLMKRWLLLLRDNWIGDRGIRLLSRARREEGTPDRDARLRIQDAWREWGRKGNCTVEGELTWTDAQQLLSHRVPTDGELFVRKVIGYDNPSRFAVQFLETEFLDVNDMRDLPNGNRVRLGIELDSWRRRVAYHFLSTHRTDASAIGSDVYIQGGRDRVRIEADRVEHLFLKERATQSRGIPWAHAAMMRLRQLHGYEEAEIIGARVGASKMGFLEEEGGNTYTGSDEDEATGKIITDAEPGSFERLPKGVKVTTFNPEHPTTAFEAFRRAMVRGISGALNAAYTSVGNDLDGSNFSSARQEAIGERATYRVLQGWLAGQCHDPVFRTWLEVQLTLGLIPNLPTRQTDLIRYSLAKWQGRGWPWVDPVKDVDAAERARKLRSRSLESIVADTSGDDWEEVLEQIKAEDDYAESLGLTIGGSEPTDPNPAPTGEPGED